MDDTTNVIRIADHIAVPESQYMVSVASKMILSHPVSVYTIRIQMDFAIDFYDQRSFSTVEVYDMATEYRLASKLESAESSISNAFPQDPLGRSHAFAHITR